MLSVKSRTRHGRFSASSAAIAAISSMRLLVVAGSPPDNSFSTAPWRSTAPQPPGPGLPLHAPSVKISTSGIDAIGRGTRDVAVEAQLFQVFDRVLWSHQCAGGLVEPVVEARQ